MEFAEVFARGGFDIALANPPCAVVKDKALRDMYKEGVYGRMNLYGLFIQRALQLANDGGQIFFINPRTLLTDRYFTNLREAIRRRAMLKGATLIADRLTRQPPIRYHKAGPRRPHAPGAQTRENRLIENGVDSGVAWRRDDGAVDHLFDMFAKGIVVHRLY